MPTNDTITDPVTGDEYRLVTADDLRRWHAERQARRNRTTVKAVPGQPYVFVMTERRPRKRPASK